MLGLLLGANKQDQSDVNGMDADNKKYVVWLPQLGCRIDLK